jgi:hypothetical protein
MTTPPVLTPVPPPDKDGLDLGGQFAALGNAVVDPPSVARVIPTKAAWLVPFVLVNAVTIAMALIVSPITANIFRNNPPEGMSADQAQKAAEIMEKFAMVSAVTTPLFFLIMTAIGAGLILMVCSVTGVTAKFRDLFSVLTYGSVIRGIATIASIVVIKAKGSDIQTMQELTPRFGLDLFIHDVPKAVNGVLRFFSIFSIWEIVATIVILAATLRITKGKAFVCMLPSILLGFLLVVVGTMFQK